MVTESRGVTYEVRIVSHKDNQNAMDRLRKQADEFDRQTTNGSKKAADSKIKDWQRWGDIARKVDSDVATSQKRNADARARAQEEEGRRLEKLGNSIMRQIGREEQYATKSEQAKKKAEIAQRKLESAINGTIHGVEQLARGFALLGIASEQDLQKAVQAFAAMEGGIQIFDGLVRIISKGESAWKAYAAARTAAAAADGVGKVAAAGTAGAVVAGAGPSVAGGAAAVGGAAFVGIGSAAAVVAAKLVALAAAAELAREVFGGKSARGPFISAGGALGRFYAGQDMPGVGQAATSPGMIRRAFDWSPTGMAWNWMTDPYKRQVQSERDLRLAQYGQTERERRGAIANSGYAADDDAAYRIRELQRRSDAIRAKSGVVGTARDLIDNARAIQGNKQEQAIADAEIARVNRIRAGNTSELRPNENIDNTSLRALDRWQTAADNIVRLEEERLDLVKRQRIESVEGEKEKLAIVKEQIATTRQQLESAKTRFQSEAERFAALDPAKAQDTVAAARVARAGQDISPYQADLLRGYQEFNDALAKAAMKRAELLGGKELLAPQKQEIANLENLLKSQNENKSKISEAIKQFEQKAKSEADEISRELPKAIGRMLATWRESILAAVEINKNRAAVNASARDTQDGISP